MRLGTYSALIGESAFYSSSSTSTHPTICICKHTCVHNVHEVHHCSRAWDSIVHSTRSTWYCLFVYGHREKQAAEGKSFLAIVIFHLSIPWSFLTSIGTATDKQKQHSQKGEGLACGAPSAASHHVMHLLQKAVQCSAMQSVLLLCILIVVGLLQLLKTRTKHFGRPCQVALPGKLWMSILGMSNHPHSFASHDACVVAPMQHHQSGRACNMVLLS